jgi:hypothetical protein
MREISNAPKGKGKKREFYQGVACAGLNTGIKQHAFEPGEKVQFCFVFLFFSSFFPINFVYIIIDF